MTVGERIRKVRKEQGITQKKLSEQTGIAEITIRNYEANQYKPKFEQLQKIANALNISPYDLRGVPVAVPKWDKIEQATAAHLEAMEEREAFLKIYDNYLNDRGKKKIHEYMEDLIAQSRYLKPGVKPLVKDTPDE